MGSVLARMLELSPSSLWKMGEASGNIADSVGGVTGVPAFTPVYNQGLIVGGEYGSSSILFNNASGSKFDFTDVYDFINRAPFTAVAWLLPGAYNSVSGHNLWSNSDPNQGWQFNFANPAVTLEARRADGAAIDTTFYTIPKHEYESGKIRFWAMRYDGTNLDIVLDGAAKATTVSTKNLVASTGTTTLAFGADNSGGSGYQGQAAYAAIYPVALTDAELRSIYSASVSMVADFAQLAPARRTA